MQARTLALQSLASVEPRMHQSLVDSYKSQHQHPLNKLCHMIGVPMITISWPLFFFKWRWALALFVAGWVLQIVGHAIEGNRPAFLRNPLYFFVAPVWLAQRVARAVGLLHSSPSK